MKIYGLFEFFVGLVLSLYGLFTKDITAIIIGCTAMIIGKIDNKCSKDKQ